MHEFKRGFLYGVIFCALFSLGMYAIEARATEEEHTMRIQEGEEWWLVAQEPGHIGWIPVRAFKDYGWCMFDLKNRVDEMALVPIIFQCRRTYPIDEGEKK